MIASFGRLGPDTILFIKPDNAIELVKIATQLGIDLRALEPRAARTGSAGRILGGTNKVEHQQTCFYCEGQYKVKINKQRVWRHVCDAKACKRQYQRDRHLIRTGRVDEVHRKVLARNLAEQTGYRVTMSRK